MTALKPSLHARQRAPNGVEHHLLYNIDVQQILYKIGDSPEKRIEVTNALPAADVPRFESIGKKLFTGPGAAITVVDAIDPSSTADDDVELP